MNKELLSKIIPYIGHGTYAYDEEQETKIDLIVGFFGNTLDCHECSPCDSRIDKYKLVLFPPDCLTREIETEYGKEIPLIEIAKMAFPDIKEWWIDGVYAQSDNIYFYFNGNDSFNGGFDHALEIQNQWELFQYMYSRHIAFNLEPRHYISVESLENNPYADHNQG